MAVGTDPEALGTPPPVHRHPQAHTPVQGGCPQACPQGVNAGLAPASPHGLAVPPVISPHGLIFPPVISPHGLISLPVISPHGLISLPVISPHGPVT
jgi:hypothetical protein